MQSAMAQETQRPCSQSPGSRDVGHAFDAGTPPNMLANTPSASSLPASYDDRDEEGTAPAPAKSESRRRNIDDCINEMEMTKVNAMAAKASLDEDTVIFLGPPPKAPEHTVQLHESIRERYSKPMFGRSAYFKLYAPAFYERQFSPTRQAKLRERLRERLFALGHYEMKYVLDVTPVTEGDDAIQAVAELQCPDGVLNWHLSDARFGATKALVGGFNALERPNKLEAYSQIRHNLAIERLLLALHGYDPHFDTAIKVYTTAILAKHFGVISDRLRDWVVGWIRMQSHVSFVEVLPEATLHMADGLQSHTLALDAFAILLGEALLDKDTVYEHGTITTHGRTRSDISEEWQSRIQYAMQSMEARVEQHFAMLTDMDMAWIDDIPEYQKLLRARPAAVMCNVAEDLDWCLSSLKAFVRSAIFHILCMNIRQLALFGFDNYRGGDEGEKLHPPIDYKVVWAQLPTEKRKFTRIFWRLLSSLRIQHLFWAKHNPSDINFHDDFAMTSGGGARMDDLERCGVDRRLTISTIAAYLRKVRTAFGHPAITFETEPTPSNDRLIIEPITMGISNFEGLSARYSGRTGPYAEEMSACVSFFVSEFFMEVESKLRTLAAPMLFTPEGSQFEPGEIRLQNVLLCLTDDEVRYLPLWAGGNDDGTGGVFNDEVPLTAEGDGFATAGPSIRHDGDLRAPSEFSWAASSEAPSSAMVHDGYSDTLDRRRVYATSEVESETSWTDVLAHRDQRIMKTQGHEGDLDVASLGSDRSERTATATAKFADAIDEEETAAEKRNIHTSGNLNDYSDIFMDSDEEDIEGFGAMDQEDKDENDEEEDMDIIDATDLDDADTMEQEPVQVPLPKPVSLAAASTKVTAKDPEGRTKIIYKRNLDEELMNRP